MSEAAVTTTTTVIWTIGERIRKAREDRGWTQADLAGELQVDRSTIAGWENNSHRPTFIAFRAIADVTGKEHWWLQGHDSPPPEGITRLQDRRSRKLREQVIRANGCFRITADRAA